MSNYKLMSCLLLTSMVSFFHKTESKLQLVNVVLRHGDRTPVYLYETYPNDPHRNYTFDPPGYGMLTANGQRRAFNLGKFLKQKYTGFIDDFYSPGFVEASSTDFNRTRDSVDFLLKALYPATSIPISFRPIKNDTLLFPILCKLYGQKYLQVINMTDVKQKIADLADFRRNLSLWTGKDINSTFDMAQIIVTLDIHRSLNLTLPSWAENIYSSGNYINTTDLHYEILNYDDEMKRLNGGMLIRKIIEDMESVRNGTMDKNRKIILYGAHDITIVAVLKALNLYYKHAPEFSSAVIIELHLLNNTYYIKVLYYLGIPKKAIELQIPECDVLCPLEKFKSLTQKVIPSDLERDCENFN